MYLAESFSYLNRDFVYETNFHRKCEMLMQSSPIRICVFGKGPEK